MGTKWLTYSDIRQRQRNNPLRQAEIPVEHAVSLPMPTLRFGKPTYVAFASPASRRPQQPMQQSAPDRWWSVDGQSGHLVHYAQTSAFPITEGSAWGAVVLPVVSRSVDELRQTLAEVEAQMNVLAPAFFTGEAGDKAAREALASALAVILPEPLVSQYQAVAPDFFHWLNA